MRYSVFIPALKTKRFNKQPRTLTVTLDGGWNGCFKKEYTIASELTRFEFDIPNEYEYLFNTKSLDGFVFNVEVTYYNAGKTRSETIQLVPSGA